MSAIEAGRGWLEQGVDDLSVAVTLKNSHPFAACFYAQQAGEKAVKSLFAFFDRSIPRSHFLDDLYPQLAEVPAAEGLLPPKEEVRGLDRFYVPTRYPDAWAGDKPSRHFTMEDADEAVNMAEKLVGPLVVFLARLRERNALREKSKV